MPRLRHNPARPTINISARIDAELVRRIDDIALQARWSRTTLITVALERFVADNAQMVADFKDGAE